MKKTNKFLSVLLALIMIISIIPMSSITASAGATLIWPVPGHKALSWDYNSNHAGIDIADGSIAGADVVAAMSGTVCNIYLCPDQHYGDLHNCSGFGTGLIIRGDDGRWYQYAHMQANSIPANVYYGAYVTAGTKIGKVGTTGNSSGNHLHFQINTTSAWNGPVNPQNESYTDSLYYTISYNANGGVGAPASQTKTHGVALTLSSTIPTRNGYTFLGWSTSSTATTATYYAGSHFTTDVNITLYAVWRSDEISGLCGENNVTWHLNVATGVMTIYGNGAMDDYTSTSKQPWYDYRDLIKTVVINDGVTRIGNTAFKYCPFTSIIIPDSVTTIGDDAFHGCYYITSITIPDSVTTIGDDAFFDCARLENIKVDSNNKYYSDEYGVLFNKNKTTLICYPMRSLRTSYTTPNSVTTIGKSAFILCPSLIQVTVSDNVTIIDDNAFSTCNITCITIPNSIKTIGGYAFANCSKLEDVYYAGTESDWNKITIGEKNEPLLNATIHFLGEVHNHLFSNWIVVNEPTCTEKGLKIRNCECGEQETAEIPILDHTYKSVVTNPTCTERGYTTYTCSCGYSFKSDFINPLGHTYNPVITQPTCTETGYTTCTCACGDSYIIDETPATGHRYKNGVCVNCGKADSTTPIEPDAPDANYTFSIQTPSRTSIRNKDGIILHTDVQGNAPAGSYVEWSWNNSKFDVEKNNDGTLTIISENNGKTTFTATLYGADGSVLATDSIEMTSKAGFFDKIGGFFRSLFGSTKIYEY